MIISKLEEILFIEMSGFSTNSVRFYGLAVASGKQPAKKKEEALLSYPHLHESRPVQLQDGFYLPI
jgi:hypothetical protein